MKKKIYIQPKTQVVTFHTHHIIATSYNRANTSGLDDDNLSGNGDDGKITSQNVWDNAW